MKIHKRINLKKTSWSVLAGLLCLAVFPLHAKDHVWIVGGGYDLGSSQAQIEKNVLWAKSAISQAATNGAERQLSVFFTDGEGEVKDVKSWQPVTDDLSQLQPLAMIYNAAYDNGLSYRNHDIKGVRGTTRRKELEQQLTEDFKNLAPGDRGLFIFNGHGGHDKKDTANNKMWLWGDTSLSVRELYGLLEPVDKRVPMRFVFTQCYSGGFERLVHPQASDTLELVDAKRCGFFAESEHREAEGCSTGINTDDYRDYSTYFFAALQGKTRKGEALPVNPDRNKNGEVSLYEAHLYTLAQAHSADLPRSTSEVYLERWQPWYLRWFSAGQGGHNVYAELAAALAQQLRLPADTTTQRSILSKQRRRLKRQDKKLEKERKQLRKKMREARYTIRYELEERWPEAAEARTANYQAFLDNDLKAAEHFIISHEKWQSLLAMYKRYLEAADERLTIERDITRFDKLHRLNKLARIRSQFDKHATEQEKTGYRRLLGCEKLPL